MNLLCSDQEGAEAALHFNPRLDESVVVFNTKEGGNWGKEERSRSLPFQRGQPFDLFLIATPEGFKVGLCPRGGPQDPGPSCGWGRPARPLVEMGAKAWPRLGVSSVPLAPMVQPQVCHVGRYVQGQDKASRDAQSVGVLAGMRGPDFHTRPHSLFICARGRGLCDRDKDGPGDRAQEQVPEGVVAADPPPPSGRGRQRSPGSC